MDEGMRVQQFDSVEEMLASMKRDEDRANAEAHPQQHSIGFGEYVVRPMPELLVWGYVQERDERNEGEDEYTITNLDYSHERGYRTGMWYSEVVPEGEPGSAHVVTLWRIRKEEFEEAKALEWSVRAIVQQPWFTVMMGRIQEEMAHRGGATTDPNGVGFVVVEPITEDDSS